MLALHVVKLCFFPFLFQFNTADFPRYWAIYMSCLPETREKSKPWMRSRWRPELRVAFPGRFLLWS
jgi:hypothetical protein